MVVNVTIKIFCGVTSRSMTEKTPISQKNLLPQSSILKIEIDGSSEMLTPIYQMSQHHVPGHSNIHIHYHMISFVASVHVFSGLVKSNFILYL